MIRQPAVKTALLYATGIVLGNQCVFTLPVLWGITAGLCISAIGLGRFKRSGACTAVVLAVALIAAGALRLQWSYPGFTARNITNHTDYHDRIVLEGMIRNYPDRRAKRLVLEVESHFVRLDSCIHEAVGGVLVYSELTPTDYRYGDIIRATGYLRKPADQRNPGGFDYREYLNSRDIYAVLYTRAGAGLVRVGTGFGSAFFREFVYPLKRYLDDFIRTALAPEQAALLRGLLIAERGAIPASMLDTFAGIGVVHILAVSGLHVGFVILIVMLITSFLRLPFQYRIHITILVLSGYACLTGLKAPVVRAALMAAVMLYATIVDRGSDRYNNLAVAGLLMLLWKPQDLFQPGFQMSFAAVFSIMYLYPKLKNISGLKRCRKRVVPRYIVDLLLVSLAAFIGTLPVTVLYFHRLPLFGIPANIVVIPLTFVAVATGFCAAALTSFAAPVAACYAWTAGLALQMLTGFVRFLDRLPYSSIEIYNMHHSVMILYIAMVLLISRFAPGWAKRWLLITGLLVANVLMWNRLLAPGNRLAVTFLDVGQGDAALLSLPDDRHILIDAGFRGPGFDAGQRSVVPYLRHRGVSRLAAVVVSHADADHLGGVPAVLRTFTVDRVIDSGQKSDTALFREYLTVLDSLRIPRHSVAAGDLILDFRPLIFYVLHPDSGFLSANPTLRNENSVAIKISYGEIDFLFTGDIGYLGEEIMMQHRDFLPSEVLKVAHHGSRTSSKASFLAAVRPRYAVISSGAFNKFGHPHPEVMRRLKNSAVQVLRTDVSAAVLFTTDGRELTLESWK